MVPDLDQLQVSAGPGTSGEGPMKDFGYGDIKTNGSENGAGETRNLGSK